MANWHSNILVLRILVGKQVSNNSTQHIRQEGHCCIMSTQYKDKRFPGFMMMLNNGHFPSYLVEGMTFKTRHSLNLTECPLYRSTQSIWASKKKKSEPENEVNASYSLWNACDGLFMSTLILQMAFLSSQAWQWMYATVWRWPNI